MIELHIVFAVVGIAGSLMMAKLVFHSVEREPVGELTTRLDFGTGVVGSAEIDGEEYDVVTLAEGYSITFDDFGTIAEQAGPAEGSLFFVHHTDPVTYPTFENKNSSVNFSYRTSSEVGEGGEVERAVDILEINELETFRLIEGTGMPENFSPTGNEFVAEETLQFQAVYAIPEPSSGILGLIALAVLAWLPRRAMRRR